MATENETKIADFEEDLEDTKRVIAKLITKLENHKGLLPEEAERLRMDLGFITKTGLE
jgi:hypothetical protein